MAKDNVTLIPVRLGDARAQLLEAALIREMDRRYGSGGPGPIPDENFDPPDGHFVLAAIDGKPIGCGGFRRLDRYRAEIKRMYVIPSGRGSGVGRTILRHLEGQARAAGYRESWLETGTLQPEAMSLYVSLGYTPALPYGEFQRRRTKSGLHALT